MIPVPVRREALSRIGRIGRGLVPAHADYGLLGSPFRIRAELPSRGSGPAGGIAKPADGVLPCDLAAIFDERLCPERSLAVTAGIDEGLELPVRHFVSVQPEVSQRRRLLIRRGSGARHGDHPGRCLSRSTERHETNPPASRDLARVVPVLCQSPAPIPERDERALQRGRPEWQPLASRIEVALGRDAYSRRRRVEHARVHHIVGQPRQLRIVRDDGLHLRKEAGGRIRLIAGDERFDLWQPDLTRPSHPRRAHRHPCGRTCCQQGNDDEGGEDWTGDASRAGLGGRRERRAALLERGVQFRRGRVAPGRVLLEAARDDRVERRRDTCANLRERRRLVVQHRRHDRQGGVPLEGAMPRQHFVEDRAE